MARYVPSRAKTKKEPYLAPSQRMTLVFYQLYIVETGLERGERWLVEARAKEKAQFTGVNEHFDAALNEE